MDAPPTPPHPKKIAHGLAGKLKGHSKVVYIAGAVVLIGLAYLAWHRSTTGAVAAAPGEDGTSSGNGVQTDYTDPGQAAFGSVGGGGYGAGLTPAATQGAFGGYDMPVDYGTLSGTGVDAAPVTDSSGGTTPDATVDVMFSAAPPSAATPQAPTHNGAAKKKKHHPTGGGTHTKRDVRSHHHPADPRHPSHPTHKTTGRNTHSGTGAAHHGGGTAQHHKAPTKRSKKR